MKEFFNPFISGSDGSGGGGGEGGTVDAYTKAQTDAMLNKKADKANVYTKTETDAAITEQVSGIVTDISELQKDSHTHSNKAILDGITQEQLDKIDTHNQPSSTITSMAGYSKPLSSSPILETDTLNDAIGKLEKSLDDKMDDGNYAGSSTNGGPATSAEKLSNTEQIGTNKKPVYFSADGIPVAIDHTINSDVPENAKFTDTKYSAGTGIRVADDTMYNMGVLSVNESATNGCVDFTIGKNGTETSESKTIPVHGLGDAAYKSVDTVVTKDSANLITSGAVSAELDKKMDSSTRNSANGVAGLDSNSKINVSQIPTTDEYNVGSAYPVTGKAIEAAMNTLPNPMLYKGSLGEGGTITALPTASASNEGFTYKVITSGAYAGQSAKVGDVFISNGTEWTIIPSGDEPEGTVISVGMSVPTGLKIKEGTSPVTTSGTIEVQLDEGYVIPKEADIVPSTRKINNITLESDIVLDGDDIKTTGYAKAESKSNITGTDTINQALGKLELKSDTNETNISTLAKHINGDLLDSDFAEDSTAVMTKTVPSGMSDYAAVKMIGGKTVKSKNLLKPQNNLKEETVNGITFTPVFDSNGHLEYVTANGTATANASFIVTKLTEDISGYILSLGLSQESVSYGIACELSISPWTTYQTVKGSGERTVPSITYTDTINVYVQVLKDAVANNVKFYPMLRKSGTSGIYEPYHEELWSAPIESVVSVGKNIAEFSPMTEKTKMNIYGAIEKGNFLKAGKYTLSYQSDYTAFLQVWLVDNMTQIVKDGSAKTITFTLPSDGKYSIYFYKDTTSEGGLANANIRNLQLEKSNEATPYSQHFKTTLLIPEAIKNLPDYGAGIDSEHCNWIDFENMVYHHDYTSADLTGKGWISDGDGIFHTSYPTNAKVNAYGICNNYTVDYNKNTPQNVGDMIVRDPTYNVMYVKVESGTSPDTTGVILYYELDDTKKERIDISDMLMPIRCETGGTITLQNEHNLDMPNSIMYKKEVSLL